MRLLSTNPSSSGFTLDGRPAYSLMFDARYVLAFSSKTVNSVNSSRSTSTGDPSGFAIPFFVITIGPIRPAFVSPGSSTCEWYIQSVELPSIGPGPARSGTFHVYVYVSPGATASSALVPGPAPSAYGAPSDALS